MDPGVISLVVPFDIDLFIRIPTQRIHLIDNIDVGCKITPWRNTGFRRQAQVSGYQLFHRKLELEAAIIEMDVVPQGLSYPFNLAFTLFSDFTFFFAFDLAFDLAFAFHFPLAFALAFIFALAFAFDFALPFGFSFQFSFILPLDFALNGFAFLRFPFAGFPFTRFAFLFPFVFPFRQGLIVFVILLTPWIPYRTAAIGVVFYHALVKEIIGGIGGGYASLALRFTFALLPAFSFTFAFFFTLRRLEGKCGLAGYRIRGKAHNNRASQGISTIRAGQFVPERGRAGTAAVPSDAPKFRVPGAVRSLDGAGGQPFGNIFFHRPGTGILRRRKIQADRGALDNANRIGRLFALDGFSFRRFPFRRLALAFGLGFPFKKRRYGRVGLHLNANGISRAFKIAAPRMKTPSGRRGRFQLNLFPVTITFLVRRHLHHTCRGVRFYIYRKRKFTARQCQQQQRKSHSRHCPNKSSARHDKPPCLLVYSRHSMYPAAYRNNRMLNPVRRGKFFTKYP
ncbi:MAG: hypothetical protein BWX80_02118 [Candidatus Hydrogenedentes bacterium ADurb.Bin101]|nr:MAG: hypothetical protein BWX80_02118 [Candidatus Hydrogenedentes bacterium ADurb.Bin101]